MKLWNVHKDCLACILSDENLDVRSYKAQSELAEQSLCECLTLYKSSNELYTSKSHSYKYAAALVSTKPCGIDVEYKRSRSNYLLSYITNSSEKDLWNYYTNQANSPCTAVWVVKESVSKGLGSGIFLPFNQIMLSAVLTPTTGIISYKSSRWLFTLIDRIEVCFAISILL
jgi:phosphopantetheinyl transferase